MDTLDFNNLDTDYTKLLKYAGKAQLPSEFILIDSEGFKTIFTDITEKIKHWMGGDPIIYDDLLVIFSDYNVDNENIPYFIEFISRRISDDIKAFIETEVYQKLLLEDEFNNYFSEDSFFSIKYNNWYNGMLDNYRDEKEILSDIIERQDILLNVENNVILTKPVMGKVVLHAHYPGFEFDTHNRERGFDLFDNFELSAQIPFINYMRSNSLDKSGDSGFKNYKKFYDGSALGEYLPFKLVIDIDVNQSPDTLFFRQWRGKDSYRVKAEQFNTGKIMLEYSYVEITFDSGHDLENRIENIMDKFSLTLDHYVEKNVNAEFILITPDAIEMDILMLFIQIDPTISSFMYVDEHVKILSQDEYVYKFYFVTEDPKNPAEVYISQHYVLGYMTIESEEYESGQTYLKFEVRNASSMDVVKNYMEIFSSVFSYLISDPKYQQYKDKYTELGLSDYVPCGDPIEISTFAIMKRYYPDIFLKYSKRCQKDETRPVLLNKAAKDLAVGRIVVPYPDKDKPLFWITSKPGAGIYPYLFENTNPDTKDKYKVIPCIGTEKSGYDNYIEYLDTGIFVKSEGKGNKILKTDKPAPSGRHAKLPSNLDGLLSRGYGENYTNFVRRGVPESSDSFIHSVLLAIDERYKKLKKDNRRISYVKRVIGNILADDDIHFDIAKQELFNVDDIRDIFSNPKTFIDPSLFYRILEEYFKINIFTIVPSTFRKDYIDLNSSDSVSAEVEIPSHSYRYIRERSKYDKTVVIYKHWGTLNSTKIQHPQCELIAAIHNSKHTSVFKKIMEDKMLEAQKFTNEFVGPKLSYPELPEASEQYIDHNGKMRGLKVNNVSFFFGPRQPHNLPATKEIVNATYKEAVKMFGKPTAGYFKNNMWLGLHFDEFYVPIKPKQGLTLEKKRPNSYTLSELGEFRLQKLRDIAVVVSNIYRWLFDIYTKYTGKGAISFMDETIVGKDKSANYNTETNIKRFPIVTSYKNAVKKMSKHFPTLFRDGKIYLYNQNFENKIYFVLKQYEISSRGAELNDASRYIKPVTSPSFFKHQNMVTIFVEDTDFDKWKLDDQIIHAKTEFTTEIFTETDPTIFKFGSGDILELHTKFSAGEFFYIIQGTERGTLQDAINLHNRWVEDNVNLGYYSEFDSNIKVKNYKTYLLTIEDIKEEGKKKETIVKFELYEDNGSGPSFLLYNNKHYSLLEI